MVALYDVVMGRDWNEKNKTLFKNPYSQFVKLETDFTKTWTLNSSSQLVAHLNGGYVWCYGNSTQAPNSELFYMGGANSVRAFSVRGVGPGDVESFGDRATDYLMRNGNLKLLGNLEYRQQLFGNLHGALFLDAGNVWNTAEGSAGYFQMKNLFRQLAVGTGIGIRYNLDFLVVRLDWGIGLHVPYETGKSGFFNTDGFKRNQTLHFAIGYPF